MEARKSLKVFEIEDAEPLWGGLLARRRDTGLVVTAEVPSYDYDETYFVTDAEGGYDFSSDLCRAMDASRFEDELIRLEAREARGSILDVGCATGEFLCHAVRRGWRGAGVEVADFARRLAGERSGAAVFASLDALPAGATYDVVTLHHVLEHIADPVSFLRDAVAPRVGCRLLIEVPNFASLAARVEGPAWKDLRPEQHVSHFEPATLRRTVEAAGLEVVDLYSLNEPLWSVHAALRMVRLLASSRRRIEHDGARLVAPPAGRSAAAAPPTPSRLSRILGAASYQPFRPLLAWLCAKHLAERLVVEARPTVGR